MNGIGVWFSLYLTKKLGTSVMGHYQLMMSVYSFGLTFASSGISFASMRLISENAGRDVSRILKKCFAYALAFGSSACMILLLLAPFLGRSVLGRTDTVFPLRILALSLPFASVSGVINGYFSAVRKVYRTAAIQIAGQMLKIGLTVWFLSVPQGAEHACTALILAGALGETGSFCASFVLYRNDRKRCLKTKPGTGKLLRIALPIALSSYLRSGLVTIKHLLVPSCLQQYGMNRREAVSAFGMIHGIVLPITLFPASLLFSFSNLMIPEVAEVRAKRGNESRQITYFIDRSLQLTLLFSFGISAFLFFYAEELMTVSGNTENAVFLKMFSLLIPVMYLDHTVDNMLKGLDEQVRSMKYNVADSAVGLIFLFYLLPKFGVYGYVFLICFCELLNFTLSIRRLSKVSQFHLPVFRRIVLPFLCAVISVLTGKYAASFLLWNRTAFLITGSGFAFFCYLMTLFLTGCWTQEDLFWLRGMFR